MKKLKTKTFYTIFLIFTAFLLAIFIISNYQNYQREVVGIRNNLTRMHNIAFRPQKKEDFFLPSDIIDENLTNRIIMDYEVYTVLLDKNNNIINVISHSEKTEDNNINTIAKNILTKETDDNLVINNLYISKYSYNFKHGNYLTIIDNSIVQERLLSILITTFISFILFEIIVFYLSKLITNWIIKPAELSFKKQKEFIADASHELKTPLSVIMASAEALESDMSEKKWLTNIKEETERMNTLVSSLLDLSKLEKGVDKQSYAKNDLSKIIEKSILTFESLAFENNLSFQSEIEKNIIFKCHALEMSELIAILLDNAIKHGSKKSKIKIILVKDKDEIKLEVINKGDEIPKEECEKIFERFYRIDKARNRDTNRYGLGLAIAKNIVLNHNGKINAFSKDGYTTFRVIFKNKEH